jgi:hypothetical protein
MKPGKKKNATKKVDATAGSRRMKKMERGRFTRHSVKRQKAATPSEIAAFTTA